MKLIKATVVSALLLTVSACVAVPVGPDYYGYGYGPAYGPGYYTAPAVISPSIGFSYYGGGYGHGGRWGHGRRGHWH
jgi:hypothetical protein